MNSKKGLTLIELLIAIAVASILAGTTVLMLKSCLDAYNYAQGELILQKTLDETLAEVSAGGFDSYGIKDSLEVLSASSSSMTFVPPWVDDSHYIIPPEPNIPMTLNRPFKAGASLPIAEVPKGYDRKRKIEAWNPVPVIFMLGPHSEPRKPDDRVALVDKLPAGAKVRFLYQPDAANFPDCATDIRFSGGRIARNYNGKSEAIPKYGVKGIGLAGFTFQYFDNANTPIPFAPDGRISKELIPQITAVKISLKVRSKEKTREGSAFVNLRNSRTAGTGIIIREGTRFKIPDSRHIRGFTITNVMGAKEGDIIDIDALPANGTAWRVRLEMGMKDGKSVIKRYAVQYPPGLAVIAETINASIDAPLNFLTLGRNGLYDYDVDEDVQNIVELKGDVTLAVSRMDCAGAALFVRP